MADKSAFKIRTNWQGLDKVIVRYRSGLAAIDPLMATLTRRYGSLAKDIFQVHAPKKTGRLARGITAHTSGKNLTVSMNARSRTGFSYGAVTRFGHRKEVIEPRTDRNVLRLQLRSGHVIYRNRVRGFRPAGDWAERARADLRSALRREAATMGRDVARVMS